MPLAFPPDEHVPGARIDADRAELDQALAEHVVGQRITGVEFVRESDAAAPLGRLNTDTIEARIYLANNVLYIARVVVARAGVVSRGEALAHIPEDDDHYTSPEAGR